jgi:hypothetical protein
MGQNETRREHVLVNLTASQGTQVKHHWWFSQMRLVLELVDLIRYIVLPNMNGNYPTNWRPEYTKDDQSTNMPLLITAFIVNLWHFINVLTLIHSRSWHSLAFVIVWIYIYQYLSFYLPIIYLFIYLSIHIQTHREIGFILPKDSRK